VRNRRQHRKTAGAAEAVMTPALVRPAGLRELRAWAPYLVGCEGTVSKRAYNLPLHNRDKRHASLPSAII
jgi:hypothetical protein